MNKMVKEMNAQQKALLMEGTVIPAYPLALDQDRQFDESIQRRLTRYYLASGVGGLAVAVHTTQFAIRDPAINLYETVLRCVAEEIDKANLTRPFLRIAGVSGPTDQAVSEAKLCRALGYDIVLLSTNGLADWTESALIERAKEVGKVMPLFGFYLQPAVGGKVLSKDYWSAFAEIEQVVAIKMAPFNRYQTLDVVQAVCASSRNEHIALYTGNDDNILLDLLTTYRVKTDLGYVEKQIVGGLLGHWAVWAQTAVALLETVKSLRLNKESITPEFLTHAISITDSNAAFFDAKNKFSGCIAGLHEVLRRQGLYNGIWCLDPEEGLSAGQSEEIDRVYDEYPELNDDTFVKEFLMQDQL